MLATGLLDWLRDPWIWVGLGLVLLLAEAMPRGGDLSVRLERTGGTVAVLLSGQGRNAALNPRIASAVQGKMPPGEMDSRMILAHLAWLQSRDAEADTVWTFGDDRVDAVISIPQAALTAAAE